MEEMDIKALEEMERPPTPLAKPSTFTVLFLLVATAAVFSYLGAYALRDAMVHANLIHPAADHDTRPFWAIVAFTGEMVLFLCVALFMRFLSWRQFRRIDQMIDADAKAE